jgi:predicted transposase/invertase (TIGR01784 family)
LDAILFKDATNLHHRFRLSDTATGRVLNELLEIHILELPRYTLTVEQLPKASKCDWWLFWLLRAQDYEPEELLRLFPEAEFQQATRSLIEIAEKTRDKMAYDKRELALRDQRAAITTALEQGRQEGELKGRQEGELVGRIVTLQELLSLSTPTREELSSYDLVQLTAVCEQLQKQLRNRIS